MYFLLKYVLPPVLFTLTQVVLLLITPTFTLTPERFLAAVERVVQSNDQFTLDDSVSVNVVHVEIPQGGTCRKRDVVNLESYLTKNEASFKLRTKMISVVPARS